MDAYFKKNNIRYLFEENYPEDIASLDLHGIYVLPDYGTIFDPYKALDYNKIRQLEMLNYKVYQTDNPEEVMALIK